MYLRSTRRTNKNGSSVEYLQLAHNVRTPSGSIQAKVVYNFGRADRVDRKALHRLAQSLRRLDTDQAERAESGLELVRSRALGGTLALDGLWQRLGIAEQLKLLLKERDFGVDMERVLLALVCNRCLDPSS